MCRHSSCLALIWCWYLWSTSFDLFSVHLGSDDSVMFLCLSVTNISETNGAFTAHFWHISAVLPLFCSLPTGEFTMKIQLAGLIITAWQNISLCWKNTRPIAAPNHEPFLAKAAWRILRTDLQAAGAKKTPAALPDCRCSYLPLAPSQKRSVCEPDVWRVLLFSEEGQRGAQRAEGALLFCLCSP